MPRGFLNFEPMPSTSNNRTKIIVIVEIYCYSEFQITILNSYITYRSCISRYLCCNVRILKNREIVRHTKVISDNKR